MVPRPGSAGAGWRSARLPRPTRGETREFGRLIRRCPALALAPLDKVLERFLDRRIERRLLILPQKLLPDGVGAARRSLGAAFPPGPVIVPDRQERPVEGRLVARKRMRRAEMVTGRPDLADRLEGKALLRHLEGLEIGRHHLQH